MTVTAYIALAVLAIMIYLIIKQYETRLVLLGGGLILCLISLQPMQGLHSFATNMVNGSLITAICSAQGFAYTASLGLILDSALRNHHILYQHRYSIRCGCGRRGGFYVDSAHASCRH